MSVRLIAQELGLSHGAVSMALHDSPNVSEQTKQRVQRLAQQLGYRPNARLTLMMKRRALSGKPAPSACFGVVSLYPTPRPWASSLHLERLYQGMCGRAAALGYRLEPLWLTEPGMTTSRLNTIIATRGIQGLLCFGAPVLDAEFPLNLPRCAVVTQGLSLRTSLHRVTSHGFRDTWTTLEKLWQIGYRRPGLVLGRYEDLRSGHAHASAYLGWCEHTVRREAPLPILRFEAGDVDVLGPWIHTHRPDSIVLVHTQAAVDSFRDALRRAGVACPDQLGVAVVSQVIQGSGFAGMEENQMLMGAWAVEMLISRIDARDFGLPRHPRTERVEGTWCDGESLAGPRSQRVRP